MNILLQIGLGLSVSFLAVWIIIIKRKVFRIKTILGAFMLTAACGSFVTFGVIEQLQEPVPEKVMSAKQMVAYCNSLLAANEYEEAMKMVKTYSEEYGYDNEASYIVAKAKALSGNYEEAQGIYARLATDRKYKDIVEDELEILQEYTSADSSYLPMIEMLENNGKDPLAYGYTEEYVRKMEAALDITPQEIPDVVIDNIEDQYDIDEYEDYIELATSVNSLYQKYVDYGYYSLNEEESQSLEDYIDDLEDMAEDSPEMIHTSLMSNARLKTALLKQDYEEFVKSVDKNSGYEELLIASELYINGAVDEDDFAEEYAGEYGNSFDKVASQLEIVMDKQEDVISHLELEEIEGMKDSLDNAEDDPVLYVLKEQLHDEVEEGNSENSKIELAISKIEHFYENDSISKEHFSEAVVTGKDSKDYEYSQAMTKIETIMNSAESDEIIHIGTYVEQAIENSMPMDSYDIIARSASSNQESTETEEPRQTFSQMLSNYVSELKSSIVIGQIDTSEFETVKASVTISSEYAKNSKELKELLSVYDCGIEITDFEIEKIEYDGIKTMLICDVSGSMSGSMGDLKNAVNNYVENLKQNESVSVVSFSDGIRGTIDFTTDVNSLLEFSNSMSSGGGTLIYDTLYKCMNGFQTSLDSNDIIILMTDGQDGGSRRTETIMSEIGSLASDKGITVYTVGLGSVDTAYLSTIAQSGNGEFVYVSDSQSLVTFYGMLQGQVDNQYLLTYKAKDTLLVNGRSLEVEIKAENIFDYKEYSLRVEGENDNEGYNQPADDDTALKAGTLAITGLDIRSAFKSKEDIVANLIGTGFDKDASTSMKLIGDLEYDIPMEYVDESTYKVTIPSSVAVGTYDIQVSVNDKTAYIVNGFSLWAAGDTKTVKYGPYTFTAMETRRTNNKIVLSGNVTMNGWLFFNGDVMLEGNLETDAQIRMTENKGSYVMFDSDTATGVGAFFAEKGIAFNMPALGTFNLYNDFLNKYDYSSYQVDSIRTNTLKIFNLVYFDSPVIKLYPDNIKLEYKKGSTILPFQDAIFTAAGIDNPFSFDIESSAVVTNTNVGIIFDFSGEDERDNYRQFNMFNAPIYLDMNELKISVNTIDHQYTFGGMIQIAFIDFGLGAEINLNGFALNGFLLTIDAEKTLMIGEVPVTFSKARIGAQDIATAVENKNFGNVTLVGQLDIAVAKVSAFFPKLKKYVGDMSIASLEDATFTFRWKPFTITTSAEMKIFDEFTLAKSSFVMGNYSFSNELLGLKNRDVVGFSSSMTQGFMWDIDNCHIDISGTGTLTGNNRFMGIQYKGLADIAIDWWFLTLPIKEEGTILTGIYFNEAGDPEFTVAVGYRSLFGNNKKLYYYIDKNGKTGDKNGKL